MVHIEKEKIIFNNIDQIYFNILINNTLMWLLITSRTSKCFINLKNNSNLFILIKY